MQFINNIQIVNIGNDEFIIVFNSKKILNYLNLYQKNSIDYSIELVINTLYELNDKHSLIYNKKYFININNFLSILYLEKKCNNDNINDFLFNDCKNFTSSVKRKIDDDCYKQLSKKTKNDTISLISNDGFFNEKYDDVKDNDTISSISNDGIFNEKDDDKNKKTKYIRNCKTFLKNKLVNMSHIRYFGKNEKKYCGTYYSNCNKIFYDGKYYNFFDFISIGKNEKIYKLTEILKFVEFKIDEKFVKLDIYI